ncbi:ABC transporter ATP-binding protein [Streptococcus infantarius subsp. infantarius CJ18]|nr:ABC transporter ATP-binding protein [Streptococcus infantarius subsp. infantarius CJ18]
MLATNEASELIDLQKELDELTEQQETPHVRMGRTQRKS